MLAWATDLRERQWLLVLAVIAVSVRLPWAAAMEGRTPLFDEVRYISHATHLCAGLGYVDEAGDASDFWPPGYPAVLALAYCAAGVHASVGIGLQILLLTLSCLLLSSIAERSFGARIGRTAALFLALYPNYIYYSTLMLTEPLCAVLLLSMTALLLRSLSAEKGQTRLAFGVGILSGLAALVRPSFLLLPVVIPFCCRLQNLGWGRTARVTFIVALASLMTLSPWMIRNHRLDGAWFEIASNGGLVFWSGNHPGALGGVYRPESVYSDLRFGTPQYDSGLGYRLGIESILSDIPATLRRSVQKLSYFVAIETDGAMWNYKGLEGAGRGLLPAVLASIAFIAAVACGLFALSRGFRNRAFGHWFLAICAYSMLIAVVFEGDPRYHFPLIPFLLVYAAAGVCSDVPDTWRRIRQGGLRNVVDVRTMLWLGALSLFLLLLVLNLWLKSLEGRL